MQTYKRIIIFPDIHGRQFWKEPIEKFENDNDTLFVFLGDYVDPYPSIDGINEDMAIKNFIELLDKLRDNKNVIFLLGNHDWHYFSHMHNEYGCRRSKKYLEELCRIFSENLNRFDIAFDYNINDKRYLFTHAGVLRGWAEHNFGKAENTIDNVYSAEFLNKLKPHSVNCVDVMWQLGPERWGYHLFGSPMWADVYEHIYEDQYIQDKMNIYQIFGHSFTYPSKDMYKITEKWAMLDCAKPFVLDCNTGIISTYNDYIEK